MSAFRFSRRLIDILRGQVDDNSGQLLDLHDRELEEFLSALGTAPAPSGGGGAAVPRYAELRNGFIEFAEVEAGAAGVLIRPIAWTTIRLADATVRRDLVGVAGTPYDTIIAAQTGIWEVNFEMDIGCIASVVAPAPAPANADKVTVEVSVALYCSSPDVIQSSPLATKSIPMFPVGAQFQGAEHFSLSTFATAGASGAVEVYAELTIKALQGSSGYKTEVFPKSGRISSGLRMHYLGPE